MRVGVSRKVHHELIAVQECKQVTSGGLVGCVGGAAAHAAMSIAAVLTNVQMHHRYTLGNGPVLAHMATNVSSCRYKHSLSETRSADRQAVGVLRRFQFSPVCFMACQCASWPVSVLHGLFGSGRSWLGLHVPCLVSFVAMPGICCFVSVTLRVSH